MSEPDDYFTFTGTRNELDLPLTVGRSKVVPFVAGTFGYEDGAGFPGGAERRRRSTSEDAIGIGEGGVRMSTQPYWCVYPGRRVPSVGSAPAAARDPAERHGRHLCRQRRRGRAAGYPGFRDFAAVADEAGTRWATAGRSIGSS